MDKTYPLTNFVNIAMVTYFTYKSEYNNCDLKNLDNLAQSKLRSIAYQMRQSIEMHTQRPYFTILSEEELVTEHGVHGRPLPIDMALVKLAHPDKVVLKASLVRLLIDNPLQKPVMVYLNARSADGFDMEDLLRSISDLYAEISQCDYLIHPILPDFQKGDTVYRPIMAAHIAGYPILSLRYKCIRFNDNLNCLSIQVALDHFTI